MIHRARAGFTLLESIVAVTFVALFALLLFSTVTASSAVSSEVVVATETSELAVQLVDELATRLVVAEVEQPPGTLAAPTATSFNFAQQIVDPGAPNDVTLGAWVSDLIPPVVGGSVRVRWVAEPQPRAYGPGLAAGVVTEALLGLDLDGDGDVQAGSAETYQVGHLALDFLDSSGSPAAGTPTVQLGRRSPTRVLWSANLNPIFSRADDPTQVVAVPFTGGDAGIRINLTIIHDPVPGPGGQRTTSVYRVSRVVSPR